MLKRLALFSFYDSEGVVDSYVDYLLKELVTVAEKIIVIVNGKVDEIGQKTLLKYADKVIIRENKGFDAGAYADVLLNYLDADELEKWDELVFCNDTFYGPFIPFADIFSKMERSFADFWGLNLSDNGLITFIQSYFLVFRKSILKSEKLLEFFQHNIDENTLDFDSVLKNFEIGIFEFLVKSGYVYDAFNIQMYHVLSCVDGSICYDKLPILKKKVFSEKFYDKQKLLNALHYIESNYDYNVEWILDDVKNRYGIKLNYLDIKEHKINISSVRTNHARVTIDEIIEFSKKYEKVFIYGAGLYGQKVRKILGDDKILGFIISDNQQEIEMEDIKLYQFSDIKEKTDIPVIVALNRKNRTQVEMTLSHFYNILYLF